MGKKNLKIGHKKSGLQRLPDLKDAEAVQKLSSRRELQGLLDGIEMAHKADILTYSSGHLGPFSLSQTNPDPRTQGPVWEMSKLDGWKDSPDFQTVVRQQAKTQANAERMKKALYDFTSATILLEHGRPEPKGGKRSEDLLLSPLTETLSWEKERRVMRLQQVLDTSELFLVRPRSLGQTQPFPEEGPVYESRFWWTQSHLAGLTKRDQLKMMKQFDRLVLGRQDLRDRNCVIGSKAAEVHERKLAKKLGKLSDQSWPNRQRLGVFSDVFDDVCDGSPVFGDLLREIKTDYDLYLNSLLDTQSALHNMSVLVPLVSLEDGGMVGAEDLEEAGQEVSRLEDEARRALEENDRVREELQNSRDRLTGIPEGKGLHRQAVVQSLCPGEAEAISSIDHVQSQRRQVWTVWEQVQQLEREIKEKMVSTITTNAIERCIRDSKAEIMRLLASNDRLRNTNKELESNISMVLNRATVSEGERDQIWDMIWNSVGNEEE